VTAQIDGRGDVAALVPAAGSGSRLGPGAPQALRLLAGQPLLVHAVRRLTRAAGVGCVVVAAPPGQAGDVRELLGAAIQPAVPLIVVDGGASRQQSVARALASTPAEFPIILVHDAARALAPAELIERVADAVRAGHPAVIPVLPVVDTIKQVDAAGTVLATIDRSAFVLVQTPQGFRRDVLQAAHAGAGEQFTDDAGLVEALGVPVHCVPGADGALKITRPVDLAFAELLLGDDSLRR
jgi:2-C-methyl-D-erythritol 4-phosphate cytidylyltransferase